MALLFLPLATPAGSPPHILHIMMDDVGHNDLGYKNGLMRSPNIDRLAAEGVRLTNHHAFKVCAPSRSSFHTGRLPWQMGYYDNSGAATPWEDVDSNRLGASRDFTLLPELLAQRNYSSHAIGKWHLGHATRQYTPTYRGYESFMGYYDAMTEDYWAHTHATGGADCRGPGLGGLWNALSNASGSALRLSADNGTYESTLYADEAIRKIQAHAAGRRAGAALRPFFLCMCCPRSNRHAAGFGGLRLRGGRSLTGASRPSRDGRPGLPQRARPAPGAEGRARPLRRDHRDGHVQGHGRPNRDNGHAGTLLAWIHHESR